MDNGTLVKVDNKIRSEHGEEGTIVSCNYKVVYQVKLDKGGVKEFHQSELKTVN